MKECIDMRLRCHRVEIRPGCSPRRRRSIGVGSTWCRVAQQSSGDILIRRLSRDVPNWFAGVNKVGIKQEKGMKFKLIWKVVMLAAIATIGLLRAYANEIKSEPKT